MFVRIHAYTDMRVCAFCVYCDFRFYALAHERFNDLDLDLEKTFGLPRGLEPTTYRLSYGRSLRSREPQE